MASKQYVGQEGDQDDGDGDAKRKNVHCRNVVNFFFTNFPPEWNKDSLHELFADVGDIAHVYVARKMSKEGKRFGFARFFRDGNIQSLANRLNRIKIGSFKLRANVAKFEKSFTQYNEGCKKDGWVFDIPPKSAKSPAKHSSSAPDLSTAENTDCKSVVIHSLFELQSLLGSSFSVSTCKVEFLGGSRFSLEFESKHEGHDLTRIDSKSTLEANIDINSGSNLIGGDFVGTSEELSRPNNTDCKVTEYFLEKKGSEKIDINSESNLIGGEFVGTSEKLSRPNTDCKVTEDSLLKKKGSEKIDINSGSNLIGGDFIDTSKEHSRPNNTDCKVTTEDFLENKGSEITEAVDSSTVPAKGIHGEILISKSKLVDPCAKEDVQLDDNDCKNLAKDETLLSHGEKIGRVRDDFLEKNGSKKTEAVDSSTFPGQDIERDILNLKSKLAQLTKDLQI